METIEITEEQRRQNQVDFAEFMLERKRQAKKEIKGHFYQPEFQSAIQRLRQKNAAQK